MMNLSTDQISEMKIPQAEKSNQPAGVGNSAVAVPVNTEEDTGASVTIGGAAVAKAENTSPAVGLPQTGNGLSAPSRVREKEIESRENLKTKAILLQIFQEASRNLVKSGIPVKVHAKIIDGIPHLRMDIEGASRCVECGWFVYYDWCFNPDCALYAEKANTEKAEK